MDLKAIKRRLRDIAADPGQPGAAAEVQRLRGAARRAQRDADVADMAPKPRPGTAPKDDLSGWPVELRRRGYSRIIDGAREDPGDWDTRQDPRRTDHWG